ncbi:MAG: signal peptidase II [Myxococcales bacterium]|nr:signal peptidase II [Myxococcales bacterium]
MQRYLLLLIGSVVSIGLDQWTKILSVQALSVTGQAPADASLIRSKLIVVSEGWFNLRLAGNKGAAWGLFRSLPEGWRVPFFVLISVVAVAVIVTLYRKSHGHRLQQVALTLILGGAIGNLIDRIRLGYVIDFIDWYKGDWHWPTFNVADICISVGVGLLIVDMLLAARRKTGADEAARIAPD